MTVRLEMQPPLTFIVRQHDAFRRHLSNFTGLWARFIPIVSEFEREWFESHGQGAWPPLAESTLERKRAAGFNLEPLRTDDRPESLYRTLIDPQQAARVEPGRLVWQTDVAYAIYHQEGGGRLPKRQVIPDPLPVEYRRRLEAATVSWVNEAAAAAFGSVR